MLENSVLPHVRANEWSRDHFSLLAYAFTCLGSGGALDTRRIRCENNPAPTRTRSGTLPGHTDLDCLCDLERMGLLVNEGTRTVPVVVFTEMGLLVGQWLCMAMCRGEIKLADLSWEDALIRTRAFKDRVADLSTPDRRLRRGNTGGSLRRGNLDSPRTAAERIAAKAERR